MRTTPAVALALTLIVLLGPTACAPPVLRAGATFQPLAGSSVIGGATFTEHDGRTTVRVEASHVAPGRHGVHVHAIGDCSAPDGSSAGDHFNPDGGAHGHGSGHAHAHGDHAHHGGHGGDLGNLEASADGAGVLVVVTDALTVGDGPRSVVGRAIVIHALPDDMMTQPGGGAGARIGCGVISQ